jgi:hypothetical protein
VPLRSGKLPDVPRAQIQGEKTRRSEAHRFHSTENRRKGDPAVNNEREFTEARSMWEELEGRTNFDAMNELHQIQIDRIEEAHHRVIEYCKDRIAFLHAVNNETTLMNAALRRKNDWLHLIIFGCALALLYLVVKR